MIHGEWSELVNSILIIWLLTQISITSAPRPFLQIIGLSTHRID